MRYHHRVIVALILPLLGWLMVTWSNPNQINYKDTTCSPKAYKRGSGQNVVAYSFYGDPNNPYPNKNRDYFGGIKENLDLVTKHYPGYVMRLYIDLEESDPIWTELRTMEQNVTNLDLCDVKALPGTPFVNAREVFAMVWRFFPTLDPQVDTYACRDLDSRISAREVAAVQEFLKSGKAIHSMRDHRFHTWVLMGCCWGANLKVPLSRQKWKMAWQGMVKDKNIWAARKSHGPDQYLLRDHVWKVFEGANNTLQQDAYQCEKFKGSLPWPTQRLESEAFNFVGSHSGINTIGKGHKFCGGDCKCPMSCRPKSHPQWEYC